MAEAGPRVAVVMSTYNGVDYLPQQIESILGQEGVRPVLVVRDDGSTDGTVALLERRERAGELTLVRGENLGVVGSFLAGMAAVPDDVDYVALSDQDDVWYPGKLARAVGLLGRGDDPTPRLYCSEYVFCSEDLEPVSKSRLNAIGVGFAQMLYETRVSGNTCVMNRALLELAVAAGPEGVYSHDWWLGLLATAVGELVFDDEATLSYRRLESSVSPTGTGPLRLLSYRVRKFLDRKELARIDRQLRRLRELLGDGLPSERRALLARFLDGGRLGKVLAPVRLRQSLVDEVALRALFALGLL